MVKTIFETEFLLLGGRIFYIGTTKMPIGTNNWDVEEYRIKLANDFPNVLAFMEQIYFVLVKLQIHKLGP